MNTNSKILLSLIAGIAAGTAFGLVLAAKKERRNKDFNGVLLRNRQQQLKNRSASMAYQNFYNDED